MKADTATKKKKKYQMEFEIKSSPRILYNYISTASGLEEWFADKVNVRDGELIFYWEGDEARVKVMGKKENQYVRYKWMTDEKKDDSYFEFEIQQDDLTSDVALIITDFSSDEDREENELLWKSQVQKLMHILGS